MRALTTFARRTWNLDPLLTGTGLAMLTLLPFTLLGLLVDERLVDGAPVWLKPAKFAASTGIYSLTLPWVLAALADWPRLRQGASTITAGVMVVEVGIIGVQAWRGAASHFNVSTPLDAVLFGIMGAGIAAQTIAAGAVAFALFRQRLSDPVMATALRAGMLIAVLGASTGGLMTSPSRAQLALARETGRMDRSGGHTVGAVDGGAGLPGIGWSREHGDLRVPHFVGLHAVQALPLLALWLRRRSPVHADRLMRVAAATYASVFGTALLQALLGQPLLGPGPLVALLYGATAVAGVAGVVMAGRPAAGGERERRFA